jgi:GntR family transcriptional regulator
MELVRERIRSQALMPGDRLPSEVELAREAGVSLITVRRALDELTRSGTVVRHQGRGTFVAQGKIISDVAQPVSLRATLLGAGEDGKFQTVLLGCRRVSLDEPQGRLLDVASGSAAWQIQRLRSIAGRPTAIDRSLVPCHLAPSLNVAELRAGGSLYGQLAQCYELRGEFEESYLEVAVPLAREQKLLRLKHSDPVVLVRGVTRDSSGRAFDCFEQVFRPDGIAFYVHGAREHRLLVRAGRERERAGRAP